MSDPSAVQIDTIQVHNVTLPQAAAAIIDRVQRGHGGYVCTPNADHVVQSHRNGAFREAVAGAWLRVPDGMWIVRASRLAGTPLRATVTGRLLPEIVGRELSRRGQSVALFGGTSAAAELAAAHLRAQGIHVSDAFGPSMGFVVGSMEDQAAVSRVRDAAASVVFVCLGAPKQELWMAAHTADLPEVVMIGVGAAVDVLAGLAPEAPRWMTRIGLEWAFRLAHEPRRLARRYLVDDPWIMWWAVQARVRAEIRLRRR